MSYLSYFRRLDALADHQITSIRNHWNNTLPKFKEKEDCMFYYNISTSGSKVLTLPYAVLYIVNGSKDKN